MQNMLNINIIWVPYNRVQAIHYIGCQNRTTTTTTKSRAYIDLAYAISGPMNIAPPD